MTRTLIDEYGDTGIVQDPDHPVVRAVTEACEARIRDIKRDVRRAAREEMCAATPREVKRLVTLGRAHLAGRSRDGSTHWDGCELEHVWCLLDRVVGALEDLAAERDAERRRAEAAEAELQQSRAECEAADATTLKTREEVEAMWQLSLTHKRRAEEAEAEVARLRAQMACSECQQPMDMCSRCEIADVCKNAGCSCFDAGCESETQARATEAQGGVK